MDRLIDSFREQFAQKGLWQGLRTDAAYFPMGEGFLCFTTDSHIVTPLFFPGGDIGSLSVNGTVNDIAVMGAEPLGLSLSFIMEEGFPVKDLEKIVSSIATASKATGVPVVTGDTKVMGRGELDSFVVNTAAVGWTRCVLNEPLLPGDRILASGDLGNHEAALLARRFGYEIDIVSDCASVLALLRETRGLMKQAKDPTRGGLNSAVQEMASQGGVSILLEEDQIPFREEVKNLGDILGLSPLNFASEGRFLCVASPEKAEELLNLLRRNDPAASIIGEVTGDGKQRVELRTGYGAVKRLREFDGEANPRIC